MSGKSNRQRRDAVAVPSAVAEALGTLQARMTGVHPRELPSDALNDLLERCAVALAGASRAVQVGILMEIGFLLGEFPGNEKIWSWLLQISKGAGAQLKDALSTTIFELVPDDPIIEPDLASLWAAVDDQQTRWVIAAAYAHHPQKMQPHFTWYLSRPGHP